jgi:hypothetical protein
MTKSLNELSGLPYQDFDHLTNSMTDKAIGELYNCSKNKVGYYRRKVGVKSYAEKHGIQVGVKGKSNITNRRHHFNESFFAVIDSEVKAYALGLFMADGHLTKEMHRARFTIQASDCNVLQAIAKAMNFENGVVFEKETRTPYGISQMALLNLNSSSLCKDLSLLGLTSSKDTNLLVPKIEASLYRHFFRGFIDGDGHISKYKNSSRARRVEISARQELLESMNDVLAEAEITPLVITKQKSIARGSGHLDILDWIYLQPCTIFLQRKFDVYLNLKSHLALD